MNSINVAITWIKIIKQKGFYRFFFEGWDRHQKRKKKNDSRAICIRRFRKKYSQILQDSDILQKLDKEWTKERKSVQVGSRVLVFVFWYQGFKIAPEIVKVCYRQLERVLDKDRYQIIAIDKDNLDEWVPLPSYIKEKVSKGFIDLTHLSDIFRAVLLYNYGGVWCDATYFLTESIPDDLLKNPIFVFKYYHIYKDGEKCSSAFLYAKPGDEIIGKVILQFQEYWKRNNRLCLYTLFHVFFTLAVDSNENCKNEFEAVPLRDPVLNEYCANNLYDQYNPNEWEYIKNLTFAHKLTYKLDKNKIKKGSLYTYITENF